MPLFTASYVVKKAPAGSCVRCEHRYGSDELTGRNGDQDDTANTLIQATEEHPLVEGVLGCIVVNLLVIRTLEASLQRI